MEQRTPDWYASRVGRVTASAISNVMMDKDRAGYRNYMAQLVCERLTGQPTEGYTSPAMQHGIDTEAEARAAYSARVGQLVEGVITRLTKFGAFARLEGDLEGLIHISEISENRIEHPKEVLKEGDVKSLRVIRIDPEQHRIGLSLRKVDSAAFADKDFKLLTAEFGSDDPVSDDNTGDSTSEKAEAS